MTTTYMPVLPVRDGSVNITVSATSFMGRDTVTRTVNIKVHYASSCYQIIFVVQSLIMNYRDYTGI